MASGEQNSGRQFDQLQSHGNSAKKFEQAFIKGEPVFMELNQETKSLYIIYLGERNKRMNNIIQGFEDDLIKKKEVISKRNPFMCTLLYLYDKERMDSLKMSIVSTKKEGRIYADSLLDISKNRVDRFRNSLIVDIEKSLDLSDIHSLSDMVGDNVARDSILYGFEYCKLLKPIDPDTAEKYINQFTKRKNSVTPWYGYQDLDSWWKEGVERHVPIIPNSKKSSIK